MKKIIDIPDEIVKELKILAVKDDSSLKKYIESLIINHNRFMKINELATLTIEDGQSLRSFSNYLIESICFFKSLHSFSVPFSIMKRFSVWL